MADLSIPIYLLVLGGIIGFLVAVLLFRSACDLVSVEPPGWLKSAGVVLLTTALSAPVNFGINLGIGAVARSVNIGPEWAVALTAIAALPLNALVAAVLYMFLLRVRFIKGAVIWVLQSLMGALVSAVVLLLAVGVWTILDGVRRLL